MENKVSETVIRRLPKYHRYLTELLDRGEDRISSQGLSDLTGFTASQIRQDLNNFGGFGQQGYGYKVSSLKEEIERILGIPIEYKSIIVGAGRLGAVISTYKGFKESGFDVVALFDYDEAKMGTDINGTPVYDIAILEDFLKEHPEVKVGILTLPKEGAQEVADHLINQGIEAIWNFAPVDIEAPEGTIVENVRLNDSLLALSYYLTEKQEHQ